MLWFGKGLTSRFDGNYLVASLLAALLVGAATPAAARLQGLDQLAELTDAVAGHDDRWPVRLLRVKQRGTSGWKVTAASVGQRKQQVDLAVDAVPAVDGQFSSI